MYVHVCIIPRVCYMNLIILYHLFWSASRYLIVLLYNTHTVCILSSCSYIYLSSLTHSVYEGESAHIVERGVLRGPRAGRGRLAGQPHHPGRHIRHEGERSIHPIHRSQLSRSWLLYALFYALQVQWIKNNRQAIVDLISEKLRI